MALEIVRRNLGERRRLKFIGISCKERTDPLEATDSYRVRATDATGNLSGFSKTASAT